MVEFYRANFDFILIGDLFPETMLACEFNKTNIYFFGFPEVVRKRSHFKQKNDHLYFCNILFTEFRDLLNHATCIIKKHKDLP